jgi:hypothetical protein
VNVWELICQHSADFSSSLSIFSSATEESKCAYTILHHPSQLSMLDVHARASMLLHFSSSPTAFDRVDEIRIFERGLTSQSTVFPTNNAAGRTNNTNTNANKHGKTVRFLPSRRKISFNA